MWTLVVPVVDYISRTLLSNGYGIRLKRSAQHSTLYTSTIFVTGLYCTMDNNPPRYPVTCEIDGKAHRGTYWIAGKILTVSTGMGGKSNQVGSTPAEDLAKQLLQKLAKEYAQRPWFLYLRR